MVRAAFLEIAHAHVPRRRSSPSLLAVPRCRRTTCSRRSRRRGRPPESAPLNLNAATEAQLEAMPGIGAATATRIVEYRKKNGGFEKVEELMNVKGIGEKSFLKLKALISVAPSRAEA